MGVDHQQLGGALAELWKFPRSCVLVASHHHNPATLSDNNRMLVTLVYVADTICCQAGVGFTLTAASQKLEEAELAAVKIDQTVIDRTRSMLPELISNAATLMA